MDLLFFYIKQLFTAGKLPLPGEICSGADSIHAMCVTSVSFALICSLATIILLIITFFKVPLITFLKYAVLGVSIFITSFFFADHALKQIEDPLRYGLEWYTIIYCLWGFIFTNSLVFSLLFNARRKNTFKLILILTALFTIIFAFLGRGNFEQITPLAGGLFAKLSWKFLWLSFNFKMLCALFFVTIFFSLSAIFARWVIDGTVTLSYLKANFRSYGVFVLITFVTLFSIPVGELLNKHDVNVAKTYINDLKKKSDKYFLENGEYPKYIESMLPAGKSPKLLARQEFFTAGVRGTYYFSRKDKYCFVFQNPTRKFGYYSITSERDWRFNNTTDSYDDSFLTLCDESTGNYDNLISGHLGVKGDDELVNKLVGETNQKLETPMSKEASQILTEKIREESVKDPSIMAPPEAPEDGE